MRAAGVMLSRVVLLLAIAAPGGFGLAAAETGFAIRAGTMIDGTGSPPVKNALIVVENGRIASIGKGHEPPAGLEVIDLSCCTVLPGFIDAHTHLIGRYIGEGENWQDASVRDLPQEGAIRGVRNAQLTLEAGFTTVRNVGASHYSDIALRDMIEEGVVPGPRMLVAGHSLGITGGHCDTNGYRPGVMDPEAGMGVADGPWEIVKEIRLQVKRGADVIKFCATGGVLSEGDPVGIQQYTAEEMKVLVEETHLTGRKVAAHAHGNQGIKVAVQAGVDSIEHGSELDDEAIRLFRKHGTYLVPTLMAQEAVENQARDGIITGLRAEKATYIAPRARESFRRAVSGDVKIALGSDAGVFPHGTQGREFVLMVENGMKPMQAIVAGTSAAADLLGLGDRIGTLASGRIADIVAIDGDPLDDITAMTRPVFVMKEGVVFRRD